MATPTDGAGWIAGLLQASDSFYPTGAYAHSFGLEGLVLDAVVHDRATLGAFLGEQALPALAVTDLPLASAAWTAAGDPPDWARLHELCRLGRAVRGSREPREAACAIGGQRAELSGRLRGGVAAAFHARAAEGAWPVPACIAFAVEGRALGAPRDAVVGAVLYSEMAGFVAAAVKLLRLGQNASQTLLAEVLAGAPALLASAASVADEDIGTYNPWWDLASSRHETADFRMFIS